MSGGKKEKKGKEKSGEKVCGKPRVVRRWEATVANAPMAINNTPLRDRLGNVLDIGRIFNVV